MRRSSWPQMYTRPAPEFRSPRRFRRHLEVRAMRITEVKTYVMGTNWRNLVFVKVFTDEGIYGVGEATLQNGEESVTAYLQAASRRHVIGSDPFNIEDLWLRMFRHGDRAGEGPGSLSSRMV